MFAITSHNRGRVSAWRLPRVGAPLMAGALALVMSGATCSGCGIIKEKPPTATDELSVVKKPLPPEKAKAVLNEVGSNFAYGPGLGSAAVNLGAVIVFPPFLLYLLGNTALSFSGYEPVTVSSLLPEESGKAWSNGYDTVVSGPGRMVAAMAGREYRSQEVASERMRLLLAEGEEPTAKARMKSEDR